MTNDYITMLAAGVFTVIVVFAAKHALRKMTGRVLPKWVMPAAAGLVMLGVTVWGEYSWYPTLRAGLPDSVAVLRTGESRAAWRPWTYVVPLTLRVMALDRDKLRSPAPGIAETELLLFQRWAPLQVVTVAYDCKAGARADLGAGARVTETGELVGAKWHPLDATDEGLKAACMGG